MKFKVGDIVNSTNAKYTVTLRVESVTLKLIYVNVY